MIPSCLPKRPMVNFMSNSSCTLNIHVAESQGVPELSIASEREESSRNNNIHANEKMCYSWMGTT